MKKKFFAMLMATTMIVGLVGCGSSEEVSETPAETIVEETSIETEVSTVEEIVVETETVEETEVVEAVPMTFEREDFTLKACVTNFGEDYEGKDYSLIVNNYTYSSNEYMDTEIMTELANRGYDIEDFIVTWMVACNETGTWSNGELTVDYFEFDDTDEYEVKLYPIFIKYGEVDSEKLVYNFNRNKEDLSEYSLTGTDNDANVWYAIHQGVADMKADENYEEINFNIPDSYFKTKTEESIINYLSGEDIAVKNLNLNDWYNGMIYAMFVSKTVDLDGLFDYDSTS